MENQTQNHEEQKQVEKRGKDKSKYVNPVLGWGLFFASLALAAVAALIVILPLV